MKVEIDGVLHVPIAEASPDAVSLRRALVAMWWGDDSPAVLDSYASVLRVSVTDDDEDGGATLDEFVAAVLKRGNASS